MFQAQSTTARPLRRTTWLTRSRFPAVALNSIADGYDNYVRGLVNAGFTGLVWAPEVRYSTCDADFARRVQLMFLGTMAQFNAWQHGDTPMDCAGPVWDGFVRHHHLRARLLPYLYTAAHAQSATGMPILRPLLLQFPADRGTRKIVDQWLLGPVRARASTSFGALSAPCPSAAMRSTALPRVGDAAWCLQSDVVTNTGSPCVWDADWCLQSDVGTNSPPQDLLVAPAGVGSTTGKADTLARDIYFPGPRRSQLWYSYWNASVATADRGGTTRTVPTPVNFAPLFVRGGAVVAMLSAQQHHRQAGSAAEEAAEDGDSAAKGADSAVTAERGAEGAGRAQRQEGAGLHVIVALSHPETGTAAGTLFIDDGVSVHPGDGAHPTAPTLLVSFEAGTRRLVSTPATPGGGVLSPDDAAFPTVVDSVAVFGVGVGITELRLSTLGPSGAPVHTRVIPASQYTWDEATGVLEVSRLRQTLTAPWALEWTI